METGRGGRWGRGGGVGSSAEGTWHEKSWGSCFKEAAPGVGVQRFGSAFCREMSRQPFLSPGAMAGGGAVLPAGTGTHRNQPPKPSGRGSAGVGGQGWPQGCRWRCRSRGGLAGTLLWGPAQLEGRGACDAGSKVQVVLYGWRCPFWQHGQHGAACPSPACSGSSPSAIPWLCSSSGEPSAQLLPSQRGSPHPSIASWWIRGGNVVTAKFGEEELTSKQNRR